MEDTCFEYVRADGSDGPDLLIITNFCANARSNILRGVLELSYAAGFDGEDCGAWYEDLNAGLAQRFYYRDGQHAVWWGKVVRHASDAYDAGVAWREINQKGSDAPSWSMTVARAHATVYFDQITDIVGEKWYMADDAASRAAHLIAEHQPVTAEQAAYAALTAFQEIGAPLSPDAPIQALRRAKGGAEERDYDSALVAHWAEEERAFVANLFGDVE